MVLLLDLPTELCDLVLSHLAELDIRSFMVSRQTCRTFETIIRRIIADSITNYGLSIHNLLNSHFPVLLDSSVAQNVQYSVPKPRLAPLQTLAWLQDPSKRQKWLRREASWRRLPLASSSGSIVRRLQVIDVVAYEGEIGWFGCNHVVFPNWPLGYLEDCDDASLKADMQPDGVLCNPLGGVNIGWLYDLICGSHDSLDGGWKFYFDTDVGSLLHFHKFAAECSNAERICTNDKIMARFVPSTTGCALLYEPIGTIQACNSTLVIDEDVWYPRQIETDDTHLPMELLLPGLPVGSNPLTYLDQ